MHLLTAVQARLHSMRHSRLWLGIHVLSTWTTNAMRKHCIKRHQLHEADIESQIFFDLDQGRSTQLKAPWFSVR